MHPRTIANIILLLAAAVLSALMVYGLVALYSLAGGHSTDSLSTAHKLGITVLAIVISILLLGALAKLLFDGLGTNLSDQEVTAISDSFSIFYELRTLMAQAKIPYEDFEPCLEKLCERLDRIYQFPEQKIRKIESLQEMVKADYSAYLAHVELGLARVGSSFNWVPKPSDKWLITIATHYDLAFLGEIASEFKHLEHPMARAAKLRYLQVLREQLGSSWQAERYIEMSETSKLPRWKNKPAASNLALPRNRPSSVGIGTLEIFRKQAENLVVAG